MSVEHETTTDDDGTSTTVSTDATDQPETSLETSPEAATDPVEDAATQEPQAEPATAEPTEPEAAEAEPETGAAPAADDAPTASETDARTTDAETTDTPAPSPTPRPGARPTPAVLARPRPPRPGAARPQAPAADGTAVPDTAPAGPTVPVRPASDPAAWGRVDETGTVFVRTADGEREVGSEPAAVQATVSETAEGAEGAAAAPPTDQPAQADRTAEVLAPYGVRFDDLVAQVDLVEQRLTAGEGAPADAVGTLRALRSSLTTVAVVGDLDALSQRTREVEAVAAAAREAVDAERAAVRAAAMAEREEVVGAAEAIAATDPVKMQWRPAGERLKELLETWKGLQRSSRLDKRAEDEMWKRFSGARTAFDRARRTHFSALEGSNAEAKAAKTALVVEAESMVTSADWGTTAQGYKRLMDRWRTAGHAGRRDDDALWARFRAAQDTFFAARHTAAEEEDASFSGNLVVKEELLVQAEALLPVRDHRAARRTLRDIGERWDEAGKVPRADLARVEGRLRKVETAVADAEKATWTRADPEKSERASGAVAQLERAVAQLSEQLAAAEAKGDDKAAEAARASLEARQGWLDAARATAQEFSG